MARIDSLQVFSEVVKTGNFTNAAQKLGLTPSAVSKQISLMESRLGVRLLNRTTRQVSTTEAGALYYEKCRQILDDLDEAEQLIAELETTPRGVLRIAAEAVFGRAILARILSEYCAAYPEVQTELFLTDHSLELVKQGFDVGIHLGQLKSPGLSGITIAQHRVMLCATPTYLEQQGEPHCAAELGHHRLIRISSMELNQPGQLDDFFTSLDVTGPFHLTVNDTDMAYHATMSHSGISPLPNYLIFNELQRNQLKTVLPDLETEAHPVQLVTQGNRQMSHKARSFVDFVVNYFA